MIIARDCPTAASAGYPSSFSTAGFHDVIMPLLSTITIASSGPAGVHRDTRDAPPDDRPPCRSLLSTFAILSLSQSRDPAPTAATRSSGHKALSRAAGRRNRRDRQGHGSVLRREGGET